MAARGVDEGERRPRVKVAKQDGSGGESQGRQEGLGAPRRDREVVLLVKGSRGRIQLGTLWGPLVSVLS